MDQRASLTSTSSSLVVRSDGWTRFIPRWINCCRIGSLWKPRALPVLTSSHPRRKCRRPSLSSPHPHHGHPSPFLTLSLVHDRAWDDDESAATAADVELLSGTGATTGEPPLRFAPRVAHPIADPAPRTLLTLRLLDRRLPLPPTLSSLEPLPGDGRFVVPGGRSSAAFFSSSAG